MNLYARWNRLLVDRFLLTPLRVAALLAAVLGTVPALAQQGEFRFPELNERYEQLATDVMPYDLNGMTITLESPSNELTLVDNRVSLDRRSDGTYDAVVEVEIEGSAELIADFSLSGLGSALSDSITVPRQRVRFPVRVKMQAVPEGYFLTPITLPESVSVRIVSRLGGQLRTACLPLAALGMIPVSCDSLERAFSQIDLPMPEPGSSYLFDAALFSPESRKLLDAYLGYEPPAAFGSPE